MDDLMGKLQSILSTKEGQEQLKNIQSMLNNSGSQQSAPPPPPQNSGFDLSSLAGMLGGLSGNNGGQNNPSPQGGGGGFDLSSLAGMLGGLGGGNGGQSNPPTQAGGGGFDLSSLAGMLGGLGGQSSSQSAEGAPAMPNIDINMIMKLQQVFQSMNVNDKNTQLLLALKPHFSEKRKAKVDQAMSMMRLFSMLPMLKESGIFAGL